jgi:hypothetical protein
MPAASSSPVDPALGQLVGLADQATPPAPADLLAVFARLADPRARRGVRHRLGVILTLAMCAVLVGPCLSPSPVPC